MLCGIMPFVMAARRKQNGVLPTVVRGRRCTTMWNFRETPLSIRAVSTEMVHEGLGTSPNSHGRGHTSPVHDLIRSSEPRLGCALGASHRADVVTYWAGMARAVRVRAGSQALMHHLSGYSHNTEVPRSLPAIRPLTVNSCT